LCQSGWLKYNKSLKNHLNFFHSFSHTGKKVYEVQIQGPRTPLLQLKTITIQNRGRIWATKIGTYYIFLPVPIHGPLFKQKFGLSKKHTKFEKNLPFLLGSCHLFTAYFIDFTKLPKTPHISNKLFTYRGNDKATLLCVFSVQFSDQTNLMKCS